MKMSVLKLVAATSLQLAVCTDYMVKMRDGVELLTTVDDPPFFPAGKKVPAVFERSPYGTDGVEVIALVFAELLGYVSVRQEMRGTKQSTGNFSVWHDSVNDAYDTIAWIIQQPWCNGEVFTTGASADGIDEYAQMSNPHPALRGQVVIFASDHAWETFYIGGAYRKALIDGWLRDTVPDQYTYLDALVKQEEQPGQAWWDVLNGTKWYGNINWPSVHWGGWFDIFQQGNLLAYHGYQHNSALPGQAKLVVDPLGHCQAGADYFTRDLVFGRVLLPILMALDFMKDDSQTNKTFPSPPEGVGNVTLYVMGDNAQGAPGQYWTTLPDYPTPTVQDWYLQPGGGLSTAAPGTSPASSTYKYDPADPVPTIGGNNLLIPCGPLDQRPVEQAGRQDLLIFTSDVLTAPLGISGALSATLYVSADSVDTDMVLQLVDVYPPDHANSSLANASILIADGIARMRWREYPATNEPQLLSGNPADVYRVSVTMWNTTYVLAAGHRLRVHVTSSNYPRFLPNPNNGLPVDQVGANVTATVSVGYDSARPSHVRLPVVNPATQLPPFPVEERVAERLREWEPHWRESMAMRGGVDAALSLQQWLQGRLEAVGRTIFPQ